jgi:cyclase
MDKHRPEHRAELARRWQDFGNAGAAAHELYGGKFEFDGIVYTPPTETFQDALTLHIGAKEVQLIEVGPAHTRGDVLVYVPQDRIVFTGDIVFNGGHAPAWAGPISNWIKACDLILGWDVETVVPGHGGITDKHGVREMKRYFEYLTAETRKRFEAGMDEEEAAMDIVLDPFRGWLDEERLIVNVNSLYREFGAPVTNDRNELHGRMMSWRKRVREHKAAASLHSHDCHSHRHVE